MSKGKLLTGCCFVVLLSRMRPRSQITVIPSTLIFYNRMERERPPDPGNWYLDTSSTKDKIHAYEAIASLYQAGIQPAVFVTHTFL